MEIEPDMRVFVECTDDDAYPHNDQDTCWDFSFEHGVLNIYETEDKNYDNTMHRTDFLLGRYPITIDSETDVLYRWCHNRWTSDFPEEVQEAYKEYCWDESGEDIVLGDEDGDQ